MGFGQVLEVLLFVQKISKNFYTNFCHKRAFSNVYIVGVFCTVDETWQKMIKWTYYFLKKGGSECSFYI